MVLHKIDTLEAKIGGGIYSFIAKSLNSNGENPYRYFSVYFRDTDDSLNFLSGSQHDQVKEIQHVFLLRTKDNKMVEADVPEIVKLKCEIIDYRENSSSAYYNIMASALDKYTKVFFLKNMLSKGKNGVISLTTCKAVQSIE